MSSSEKGLTRRQVLVSAAAAAGYALAARPLRAEAIHTDAEGLEAGMVEIPAPDGPLPAYRAQPATGRGFPVVLVVHEIFGLHEYIRDVCRRLAHRGYLALAPDLYRRQGDVTGLEDIEQVFSIVRRVEDAQVMADLDTALAWARAHGGHGQRAAITGFCWGGRIVWLYAAHRPTLSAGVAWYGRLSGEKSEGRPRHPLDVAEEKLAPVLGLYGGEDRNIPMETVFAMRKRLVQAGQASEIVVFPAAPHGFHADYRESYHELAASEAWRRMLAWFERFGMAPTA